MKLFKNPNITNDLLFSVEEAGLYDVCEWWIENYPEDIFVNNPKEVVEIRNLMKKILKLKKCKN